MKVIKQKNYLNYNIIEYNIVDSTMNLAKSFPENTIILAAKQENGRGKESRVWSSENSNNLYFSLNIKATKKKLDYSQLSFLSSLAMRQAIQSYNKDNNNVIVSKWPNDILINNKKVCGILLEFDFPNLVIGVGVNIDLFPKNTIFEATSLKQEGIILEKYKLLEEFLNNFDFLIKEWENINFSIIREKWLQSCYKLNEEIEINGQKCIFKDIDKDGTLIVKLNNGENMLIKSGDIF